ncbi:hypothetical protein GQ43DRAFT_470492 [Delitschia confertaspora ATCC 74209]|uniref:Uncharacterized protein n=1 Tax=Delitschia confertaspora ATCC 74209 TaxID=1513339 RepID=A0A9P4MTT1_9PLEO|nr:hypothetical protein GQ43DRAFT_470492 [Delitschia confertaspora ATCC 74209]
MTILDCKEFKVNCSSHDDPVDANPDIAGVGVIISFLATTCLAFAITCAVMFLQRFNTIRCLIRKYITKNPHPYMESPESPYWRSAKFWAKVLSKNLLAFSDTQLVTGLAIQFTAIIQHCTLSVYHFQVVVELAFLTTVTHMLALVALRNYFVRNKWINLPRIGFMLANLALLGYTSYVAYSYDLAGLKKSSSLACFYQGKRPKFKSSFGGRWAALLVGAIGGHVTVIVSMYFLDNSDNPADETSGNIQPPNSTTSEKWKHFGGLIRTWFIAPVYAIYGLIMAGVSLRRTQALGNPYPVIITGSEKNWSFGQFLPVLLLALPLFAGWESFWEEKEPDSDRRWGILPHASRSRSGTGTGTGTGVIGGDGFEMQEVGERKGTQSVSDIETKIESRGSSRGGTPRLQTSPSSGPARVPTPTLGPTLVAKPLETTDAAVGLGFFSKGRVDNDYTPPRPRSHTTNSLTPSPSHTPRARSATRTSLSPRPSPSPSPSPRLSSPLLSEPSPHLTPPLLSNSPRPRSPSRFEEHVN